ncbi:DUF3592 domain-containing protein [Hymenobacter taeanensis]|uniref:DUF3592 domain-containing protein n=1 Tax=Hymenobacter taeanensis TaxID=2735321 RepID=A0A6M6BE97_9BACT|nr:MULTISPECIES: DUF3592 domain-containing protein [Hymenobacter]QJX46891.1 DUF3592 domain-containing protein [Hymenobacter taeanensis]UOQ80764.1 DUF3592 domain-containing protein [Hymenobacter sp. 5414T-23]
MVYIGTGVFVALFVWLAYRLTYLQLHGIRTVGTIVEIIRSDSGDGTVYYLMVAFTTIQGKSVRAKSLYGAEEVGDYFRVGEKVDILYSAKRPEVFAIQGFDVSGLFLLFLMTAFVVAVSYWGFIEKI